jgi:glycosyltransferase involved in cell wall biosynthesis
MLSIIVSWKNRKELARSIESLLATAAHFNGELVLVNFDGDTQLLAQLMNGFAGEALKIVNVKDQPLFNKSASNNLGAFHARFDHFFFCDCDIIMEPATLQGLFGRVQETEASFGTLEGVKETIINSIQNNHIVSFGYELFIRTKNGRTLKIVDSEEDANDGSRNAPGLLLTSKRNFESINGYNSNLVGWGWEDQDMISRLTLGAGLTRKIFGKAYHISHDDQERTKHYPISNRWESRDKMFRQALANYDADQFMGTYSKDISTYQFSS